MLVREPELLQHSQALRLRGLVRDALEAREEDQVLHARQLSPEHVMLRAKANLPPVYLSRSIRN